MSTSEIVAVNPRFVQIEGRQYQVIGAKNHEDLVQNHQHCGCCGALRDSGLMDAECNYCRSALPRLALVDASPQHYEHKTAELDVTIQLPDFTEQGVMHVGQGNNVFGYDLGFPKESFADIAGSNTVTVLEYDATVKDLLVSPEVISSASIQAGTIVTSKYSDQPIGDGKSFINELFITPGGMAYIGPNTEIDYLFLGPGAEAIMRENTSVSALYTIEESYETSGNGKVGSIYRITTDQYLDRANMHINRAIKAYESAKVA